MPTYHSFTGKGILRASVCVICTCMFTACETLVQEQQVHESAQIRTEIVNLQVQVQRLSSRLDGIQAEREQLYAQLESLQRTMNENTRTIDQRAAIVEASMASLAERQKSDKRETVETLSKQMAQIVKEQSAAVSAPISRTGYEHQVKPGQTLSEIASAYGVTREAIMKANNMKDANVLRVGQTLFIPE